MYCGQDARKIYKIIQINSNKTLLLQMNINKLFVGNSLEIQDLNSQLFRNIYKPIRYLKYLIIIIRG